MSLSALPWVVILDDACYGPFDDEPTAKRFAEFLTREVDPAVARRMLSPVREMLGFYGVTRHADKGPRVWSIPEPPDDVVTIVDRDGVTWSRSWDGLHGWAAEGWRWLGWSALVIGHGPLTEGPTS